MNKEQIQTKYEAIRKMTKEEMADFLFAFCCSCKGGLEKLKENDKDNYKGFLEYLNGYYIW